MIVLKKTATVAAIAAAALLSASPLALADDKKDGHDDGHKTIVKQEGDGGNNACKNTQVGEFEAIGGNSGLLGVLPILNGINALDQVNALQCVNLLNNNLNGNEVGVAIFGDNTGGHDNNRISD
jgi:hypothetical protein